jgi:hypothetical protein
LRVRRLEAAMVLEQAADGRVHQTSGHWACDAIAYCDWDSRSSHPTSCTRNGSAAAAIRRSS